MKINRTLLPPLAKRFRGFLPVIIDVETAGFNPNTDALLEIAAVTVTMDKFQQLVVADCHAYHIEPFVGSHLAPEALEFTKIDPTHPFRFALEEKHALTKLFHAIRTALKQEQCHRAILVGHNPSFDLSFLQAAVKRCQFKRNPFHAFTTFDTATLSGLVYGQTVLAKALQAAKISFDPALAHSAIYDAKQTAELFCKIVNRWKDLNRIMP
jgi:ribonuclease T